MRCAYTLTKPQVNTDRVENKRPRSRNVETFCRWCAYVLIMHVTCRRLEGSPVEPESGCHIRELCLSLPEPCTACVRMKIHGWPTMLCVHCRRGKQGGRGDASPPITDSVRPFVRPPVRPSVRPFDRPSVRPCVRPSVRPSDRPSVRPCVRPFDQFFLIFEHIYVF